MTLEEFKSYMNRRFDEMIERSCPQKKDEEEKEKNNQSVKARKIKIFLKEQIK